jgi:hypothetical protein
MLGCPEIVMQTDDPNLAKCKKNGVFGNFNLSDPNLPQT